MSSRFYAVPLSLGRSARIVMVGAALLGVAALSAIPSPAHATPSTAISPSLFQVDAPTPYSVLSNGTPISITGWTAGRRVAFYLDGPPGVGTGIGSVDVDVSRPDVAARMGAELAYSGFEIPFTPLTLSSGEHMLFAYSLIDGAWAMQTIPVLGAGNVLPPERSADGDDAALTNSELGTDPGSEAPGGALGEDEP